MKHFHARIMNFIYVRNASGNMIPFKLRTLIFLEVLTVIR